MSKFVCEDTCKTCGVTFVSIPQPSDECGSCVRADREALREENQRLQDDLSHAIDAERLVAQLNAATNELRGELATCGVYEVIPMLVALVKSTKTS